MNQNFKQIHKMNKNSYRTTTTTTKTYCINELAMKRDVKENKLQMNIYKIINNKLF